MAYLPLVSSPTARKRYTSPTTAMVRPSVGFVSVGLCVSAITFTPVVSPRRTMKFSSGAGPRKFISRKASHPHVGRRIAHRKANLVSASRAFGFLAEVEEELRIQREATLLGVGVEAQHERT